MLMKKVSVGGGHRRASLLPACGAQLVRTNFNFARKKTSKTDQAKHLKITKVIFRCFAWSVLDVFARPFPRPHRLPTSMLLPSKSRQICLDFGAEMSTSAPKVTVTRRLFPEHANPRNTAQEMAVPKIVETLVDFFGVLRHFDKFVEMAQNAEKVDECLYDF